MLQDTDQDRRIAVTNMWKTVLLSGRTALAFIEKFDDPDILNSS